MLDSLLHSKQKVWTSIDHPLLHDGSHISYINSALPPLSDGSPRRSIKDALDYIYSILYPRNKGVVDTVADLPASGNSYQDYYLVSDAGDGKYAGYSWMKMEGDLDYKWYKVYDPDWGANDILQQLENKTFAYYVFKLGFNDIDSDGVEIAGNYAGKRIWGGKGNNKNLTLSACDGSGGYIQCDDDLRPVSGKELTLGTATEKFKDLYLSGDAAINTLLLSTGSITDSTGSISFGDENLSTTGSLTAGAATVSGLTIATDIIISSGSITSNSGTISFGNENLNTTGNINGTSFLSSSSSSFGSGTTIGNLTLANSSITASSGVLSFGDENLSTTGTFGATSVQGGNLTISGDSINSVNGIAINPGNSTATSTAAWTITGSMNIDNLSLDGNTLTTIAGDLNLSAVGHLIFGKRWEPISDNNLNIGDVAKRVGILYLGNSIHDGTNSIGINTLLALRDILTGVVNGATLFYDQASGKFLPSLADTEINHGEISGLNDDDHLQYMLLAGRAAGQALIGGVNASATLSLESTSHATKGTIIFKDSMLPSVTNQKDLGSATAKIKDIYTAGILYGGRRESVVATPATSALRIGEVVLNTTENAFFGCGVGGAWKRIGGGGKYFDITFNGTDLFKNVDVSSYVSSARNTIAFLKDIANNYRQMNVMITNTDDTTVRIETSVPLPAGTYRLILVEGF